MLVASNHVRPVANLVDGFTLISPDGSIPETRIVDARARNMSWHVTGGLGGVPSSGMDCRCSAELVAVLVPSLITYSPY